MAQPIYKLLLHRIRMNDNTIFGKLELVREDVDGKKTFLYLCNTVENAYKAIPRGRYMLDHTTTSPKYDGEPFYERVCECKLPRLVHVPDRRGILIHCGNSFLDSAGCILVGQPDEGSPWRVVQSRRTFESIYPKIKASTSITII